MTSTLSPREQAARARQDAIDAREAAQLNELASLLREQGLRLEKHWDSPYRENWYRKAIDGGTGYLRVVIHPDDGNRVEIHRLDRHQVEEWGVAFSGSTPHTVLAATLRAMAAA